MKSTFMVPKRKIFHEHDSIQVKRIEQWVKNSESKTISMVEVNANT